jgi:hypothetical protein
MKRHHVLVTILFVLLVKFDCASTKVSDRETYSVGKLPRPGQIIVYDFVTTPDGVAPDSALAGQTAAPATPPNAEQVELEKQVGMQIAEELAANIRAMGLSAVQAGVQGYGEYSGSSKIQGRAKQAAREVAEQLKIRFKEEGWIQ